MSVRSSRRGHGEGWQLAKGVAVWTCLLIGSFAFGLFIISPIINRASGANAEPRPKPASQPEYRPPAPSSQPDSNAAAIPPARERRATKRDTGPDIQLGPDMSAPAVQNPDSLDNPNPERHSRRSRRSSRPTESTDSVLDANQPSDNAGATEAARDEQATTSTSTDEQPAKPKRRRRARSSESNPPTEDSRPTRKRRSTEETQSGKDIQKGESIDNFN